VTRSLSAQKRRAEKRGLTVAEMLALDEIRNTKALRVSTPQTSAAAASNLAARQARHDGKARMPTGGARHSATYPGRLEVATPIGLPVSAKDSKATPLAKKAAHRGRKRKSATMVVDSPTSALATSSSGSMQAAAAAPFSERVVPATASCAILASHAAIAQVTAIEERPKSHRSRKRRNLPADELQEGVLGQATTALAEMTSVPPGDAIMSVANRKRSSIGSGGKTKPFTIKNKNKSASKEMEWPEQAGPERIVYNKILRERYASDPTSLTQKEQERAELLIARDARKQAKKSGGNSSDKQQPALTKCTVISRKKAHHGGLKKTTTVDGELSEKSHKSDGKLSKKAKTEDGKVSKKAKTEDGKVSKKAKTEDGKVSKKAKPKDGKILKVANKDDALR